MYRDCKFIIATDYSAGKRRINCIVPDIKTYLNFESLCRVTYAKIGDLDFQLDGSM